MKIPLTRLLAFLAVVLSIALGVALFLDWRLVAVLQLPAPWTAVGHAVVLSWVTLIIAGMIIPRLVGRSALGDRLAWVAFVAMGLLAVVLPLVVVRDLLVCSWRLLIGHDALAGAAMADPTVHLRTATVAILVVGIVLVGSGIGAARRVSPVRRLRVPIAGLPRGLHGLRVVQLSDIHAGPTIGADFVRAVVQRTNGLRPDIVVLTGDLVDGSVAHLAEHVAPLAGLRAPLGRFFVTGNHEYYSGAEAWVEHLGRLGFRVLMNEHVVVERGGGRLVIAGVTDRDAARILPSHRSDPVAAFAGAPAGVPRLLLAHQPRSARDAQGLGVDLQISGHTHGGQIWPWMHLVRLQQPTVAGWDRVGDVPVYTSRGTGTWGPPLRVGAPSEITLFELVSS